MAQDIIGQDISDDDLDAIIATGGLDIVGASLAQRGDTRGLLSHLKSRTVSLARAMKSAGVNARRVAVVDNPPTNVREFPLGFESLSIAAGATIDIKQNPQVVFRGDRLVIPSDIAGDFAIVDIKVGKDSQLGASGAIPARTFQENAVAVRLLMRTAQISQEVILSVKNIAGVAKDFRACLIGTVVE